MGGSARAVGTASSQMGKDAFLLCFLSTEKSIMVHWNTSAARQVRVNLNGSQGKEEWKSCSSHPVGSVSDSYRLMVVFRKGIRACFYVLIPIFSFLAVYSEACATRRLDMHTG